MSTPKHPTPASSGTAGFFQTPPALVSSFEEDVALRRMFKFYLPSSIQESIEPDLARFSNLVITSKIRAWCADAERNVPYVKHWDAFGNRIDELVTTAGWRELQRLGIEEGIVALGHDAVLGRFARPLQFVKYHVWTPWNACVTCPSAMTDGGARLLALQLGRGDLEEEKRGVFERAHACLTSRDPEQAWTSGQWMTERPGGSDVRNTETLACDLAAGILQDLNQGATDADGSPLGPVSVSGFKWFSSATDANATVLLAKEPDGGISAFFAPTRKRVPGSNESQLNGIQIQRMKSKLGTRALPTAELVLSDMRAWRIGSPGQGVKEISTVLNITRVHNAVTAVGYLGRGLAISRAFSRIRRARGRLLMDTPVHVHTLAGLHVEYRAVMHLAYYTATLLGLSEAGAETTGSASLCESAQLVPTESVPLLLRLLTPLAKMLTAKASIAGLAECMESLGGVGYLENEDPALNIARLFRDANVLSIWEGTSNIMADDVLRIVKGPTGPATLAALDGLVSTATGRLRREKHRVCHAWAQRMEEVWGEMRAAIDQGRREDLGLKGRLLCKDLGWIICSVLLAEDALSDQDGIAIGICDRWISLRDRDEAVGLSAPPRLVVLDKAVVFGLEYTVLPRL